MKKLLTIVCTLAIACSAHICAQGKRTLLKNWTRSADAFANAPTTKNAKKAIENLKNYAATFQANMPIPSGTTKRVKKLYEVMEFKKALNTNPALIKRVGIVMIPVAPYKLPTTGITTIAALKTAMDDIDSATFPGSVIANKKEAAKKLINKYKADLLKKDKTKIAKTDTEALIKKYQEYTKVADKDLMQELAEALFYAKMDTSDFTKAKDTITLINTFDNVSDDDKKALEKEFIKAYIDANVASLPNTIMAARLVNELKSADKKAHAKYLIDKAKDTSLNPGNLTKNDAGQTTSFKRIVSEIAKAYGKTYDPTTQINAPAIENIVGKATHEANTLGLAYSKLAPLAPGGAPGGAVPPKKFEDMNLTEINTKYNNNVEIKKLKKEDVETITATSTLGKEIKNLLGEDNLLTNQKNKLRVYVNIIKWATEKSNNATLKTVWNNWLKEAKNDFIIVPTI